MCGSQSTNKWENRNKTSCIQNLKFKYLMGNLQTFDKKGNLEIFHNIYASLNGKKHTNKSLNVCLCVSCNTLFVFLLFTLSCCFYRINAFFRFYCWCSCCCCCCCWYSSEPKVIFDYRSLHRVKGKRKHCSNNGSLVYTLFAKVKPNQVCVCVCV